MINNNINFPDNAGDDMKNERTIEEILSNIPEDIISIEEYEEILKNHPEEIADFFDKTDLMIKQFNQTEGTTLMLREVEVPYKELDETLPFGAMIQIIFGNKCINENYCPPFDEPITFEDILEIAKENGYKEVDYDFIVDDNFSLEEALNSVITLILNNDNKGVIYHYGNIDNERFYQIGTTIGGR